MEGVVLNSFVNEARIPLAEQLVIDPDAIVSQGFPVAVSDALADLEELLIVLDGLLRSLDVVQYHAY